MEGSDTVVVHRGHSTRTVPVHYVQYSTEVASTVNRQISKAFIQRVPVIYCAHGKNIEARSVRRRCQQELTLETK